MCIFYYTLRISINMEKFLNIFLNIVIILLICYLIFLCAQNFWIAPKEENAFQGTIITDYEELTVGRTIVDQYILAYREGNYDKLSYILTESIQKENTIYEQISRDIPSGTAFITYMEKDSSHNYKITYVIGDSNVENVLLVKTNPAEMTFEIQYDSIIEGNEV